MEKDEIEVTPQMIEAGAAALVQSDPEETAEDRAIKIFRAMVLARIVSR